MLARLFVRVSTSRPYSANPWGALHRIWHGRLRSTGNTTAQRTTLETQLERGTKPNLDTTIMDTPLPANHTRPTTLSHPSYWKRNCARTKPTNLNDHTTGNTTVQRIILETQLRQSGGQNRRTSTRNPLKTSENEDWLRQILRHKMLFCLPHKMTQQHLVTASLDELFSLLPTPLARARRHSQN